MEKIKKIKKMYRELKNDGGYSSFAAFIGMLKCVYYCAFEQEVYNDIKMYDYLKLRHPDIYKTTFVGKDNAELLPQVNDEEELPILKEKHRLLEILNGGGRRYFYVAEHSEKELAEFLRDGGSRRCILKPNSLAGSYGISFICTDEAGVYREISENEHEPDCLDIHALYEELKANDTIIEEYICQHHELDRLFSGCVNTIYIHTVRLPDGSIEVTGLSTIICGTGSSRYANNGYDLVVGIKPDGYLYSKGFLRNSKKIEVVTKHPDSGIVLADYQLPYWEESKALAIECAKKIPNLTYIKWDVAITENGPVIIEGNGLPMSYYDRQLYSLEERHCGIKEEYSEFLRSLTFSRTLTDDKIKKVNDAISDFGDSCSTEVCNTVVVLGSSRAISRIKAAYEAFSGNPDTRYILCGGSDSIYPENSEKPDGKKLTEAEYMKKYLLEHGVNENRIMLDNTSKNTIENLINAAEIIGSAPDNGVAIASAWFHGRRVKEFLRKLDNPSLPVDNVCFVPAIGKDTKPDNWYKSMYGIQIIYHEWKYIKGNL